MPLPTLESPKYTVVIPSSKKTVEYRPYLVKEEKILMMAMESGDEKQMMAAVKDIVRACTFDKVVVDDLTTVDLEYIFLKLRAKSIGESATVKLSCLTEGCDGSITATIDLNAIEPISSGTPEKRVEITDKIGMTLKPITVRSLGRYTTKGGKNTKSDQINDLIIASIESIYDTNGVYRAEDHSIEELTAFIDALSSGHLTKIRQYIESLPRLSKDIEYTCPKCKIKHKITLTGLQSFFA